MNEEEACPIQPNHKIVLEKVANGFIAKVGCQTFVFETWEKLGQALHLYYTKPEEAVKKYMGGK